MFKRPPSVWHTQIKPFLSSLICTCQLSHIQSTYIHAYACTCMCAWLAPAHSLHLCCLNLSPLVSIDIWLRNISAFLIRQCNTKIARQSGGTDPWVLRKMQFCIAKFKEMHNLLCTRMFSSLSLTLGKECGEE